MDHIHGIHLALHEDYIGTFLLCLKLLILCSTILFTMCCESFGRPGITLLSFIFVFNFYFIKNIL